MEESGYSEPVLKINIPKFNEVSTMMQDFMKLQQENESKIVSFKFDELNLDSYDWSTELNSKYHNSEQK